MYEVQAFFVVVIAIALFVIFVWASETNKKDRARMQAEQRVAEEKNLQDARIRYEKALSNLKANPSNADLREETLELGRRFSFLTRQGQGLTVFDEVALMNDINATSANSFSTIKQSENSVKVATPTERL